MPAVAKKLLVWLLIAFVIFYLVTQPTGSANVVKSVAGGLANAAQSLATFVGNLQ